MNAAEDFIAKGALQTVPELTWTLEQLKDHGIASVLEIGCYQGGLTRLWCSLGMDVTAVDLENLGGLDKEPGVRFLQHRSDDPMLLDALLDATFDIVYIDGDHSYEGAKHDWETFGPMARVAVIFHDIADPDLIVPGPDWPIDWRAEKGGVYRLWQEIRGEYTTEFPHQPNGVGIVWMR